MAVFVAGLRSRLVRVKDQENVFKKNRKSSWVRGQFFGPD